MNTARTMLALAALSSWVALSLPIRAAEPKTFIEDFDEADGTPEDWVVYAPEGVIEDGWLALRATPPTEPYAWAGREGIPIAFDRIESVSFTIDFLGPEPSGTDLVGRHGGAFLCAKEPTSRAGGASGYLIDWIDRVAERGYRAHKYADGVLTPLGLFPVLDGEPGVRWTIEFDDDGFTLIVDDAEIGRCDDFDNPYRGGYVGLWCYSSAGQEVLFDDVEIVYTTKPCPSIRLDLSPGLEGETVPATILIPLDANATEDYTVTVTSWDTDIATPAGGTDGSLDVVFAAGEPQAQTIRIDCVSPGETEICVGVEGEDCAEDPTSCVLLPVIPAGGPFCDDFSGHDEGFPPFDWTVLTGSWIVTEETLDGVGSGVEAWIVAGDPPAAIESVETITATIELSNDVDFTIGKHGGILFFAQDGLDRWNTRGYTVDWIDRAADRGYRFIRFEGNRTFVVLDQTLPGDCTGMETEWRVEADDEWIWFYADDELVFEVQDGTYRGGHFALWTHSNNTHLVADDVRVGDCGAPPDGQKFVRGSTDGDTNLTIGDAVGTLNFMFASGATPGCLKAADCDDNGTLTIGDPILFLTFLFASGPPPQPPIPGCGPDPTPDDPLTCESFPGCP
ncbi:MAG: hypothetical protein JXP34_08070 [Planctomycetes bacterium]|nr:hypothetical protein [Planctomycetota bacterium]